MSSSIYMSGGGVYVQVSGAGGGEKTNFGKETVASINVQSSARLNGTTVTGKTSAAGSVTAKGANVQVVDAGGSIHIAKSFFHSLDAGGSIDLDECQGKGKVDAGGSVTAKRCKVLGLVDAGGAATLDDCASVQSVKASHVTLTNTKVLGDVIATDAEIEHSVIRGKLTCVAERIVITASTIDTIFVKSMQPYGNGFIVNGGASVTIMGSMVIGGVGAGNSVFINGVPLDQAIQQSKQAPAKKQVIELQEGCVVGKIIFEGEKGEVILKGKSQIGSVTGGKIIKVADEEPAAHDPDADEGAGEGAEESEVLL